MNDKEIARIIYTNSSVPLIKNPVLRAALQEPRNMAEGGRIGFDDGQLVTPSVDGSRPGYKGEQLNYLDNPEFKKFYEKFKKEKPKGKLSHAIDSFERLKIRKNKIVGLPELFEALHSGNIVSREVVSNIPVYELSKANNPYSFRTLSRAFSDNKLKITKDMTKRQVSLINNGKKLTKIIIDVLGEPTTLSGGKSGQPVWDLNPSKIKKLNKELTKYYSKVGDLREATVNNIFNFSDNNKLMKAIDNYKGGKLKSGDPLLEMLVKEFKGGKDPSYTLAQLARAFQGKIQIEGIDKNLKKGNKIVKLLGNNYRGPLGNGFLHWAKLEMGKHFDDPNATYKNLTNTIKNSMKEAGITNNLVIDEIFPARTGQLTLGKGSGAYNQIVQLIDGEINSKAKVNFDGKASIRYQNIIKNIKDKNWDEVNRLVKEHDTSLKNFYETNPQAKGRVKLPQLNYDPVKKRFASPTEIYGKDVFPSKIQKDIDKFYRKTGLSLDVGSTMTLEKAAKDLEKVAGDPKAQMKILKQMGYRCRKAGGAGESLACYMDDVKKTKAQARKGNPTAIKRQKKAFDVIKQLPKIGKFVRQGVQVGAAGVSTALSAIGLGPVGIAIEGAIEGAVYDYYRKKGYSHDQAFAETFSPRLITEAKKGKSTEDVPWYGGAEELLEKEKIGTRWDPSGKVNLAAKYADAQSKYNEALDKYYEIQNQKPGSVEQSEAIQAALAEQEAIIRALEPSIKAGTPEYEAYRTAEENQTALMDERAKDYKSKNRFLGLEWDLSPEQIKQRTPSDFKEKQMLRQREREMDEYKTDEWGEPVKAFSLKWDPTLGDRGKFKDAFQWDAMGFGDEEGIKNKWQNLYEDGGVDLLDRIGIAGGVANMAGGGIATIRRPNAIPPESGPTPQGLPSILNRVKRI